MIHPRIEFFPRDLWVGVFIGDRVPNAIGWYRRIYICPVPCIVISFDIRVGWPR